MKKFYDGTGKAWIVSINVATIKQVRDLTGVNLLDVFSKNVIGELQDDVIKLVDVLYILCSEQAEKEGVSDVDFGKLMAGETLVDATNAFLQELIDFFPEGKKKVLMQMLDKIKQAEKQAIEITETRIAEITEEKIKSILEKKSGI